MPLVDNGDGSHDALGWVAQPSGPPSPTTPPARQAVQLGLFGRPAQFVAQIGGLLTTIYDRHSEL